MTRVNAGVRPRELHRLHLIAEYREIPMVPAALRRSLRTKTRSEILSRVPETFTLGAGHVRFFYDKLRYLQLRYAALREEMIRRGYEPDENRDPGFSGFDRFFRRDWNETAEARRLVLERIALRISEKPHLYVGD